MLHLVQLYIQLISQQVSRLQLTGHGTIQLLSNLLGGVVSLLQQLLDSLAQSAAAQPYHVRVVTLAILEQDGVHEQFISHSKR